MARFKRGSLFGTLSISLGVLVLLGTAAAWLLVPTQYEAFALLKVSGKPPSVLERRPAAGDEFAIFKRTQAQMIRSGLVLQGTLRDSAINKLSLIRAHSDDPIAWLNDQLVIDYPDDAEILRVAMKGANRDEVVKIVNKIVEVYLKEVVQRERDMRLEQEAKLQASYSKMTANLQKQQDSLHTLEALHMSSGSKSAELKKKLAGHELDALLERRERILDQLDDTALQLMLRKEARDTPKNVRTAEPAEATQDQPENQPPLLNLSLALLEKQREYLEARLKALDEGIEKQVDEVEALDNFNATVAGKQEDMRALLQITRDLRNELDRIKVEQLVPERIIKLDDAVLANGRGDAIRRYAVASLAGALGMGLIAVGATVLARRER